MNIAVRYAVALVTTAVAVFATIAFPELLAPMRFFFLWAAVLITAVVAGTGPGLLATALALLGATYFMFAPIGSVILSGPLDYIRLTLFGLFAGGISAAVGMRRSLSERLRTSEQRYRTLVESTPVSQAVWTASPEGRVRWGTEWNELTGGAQAPFHPEDLPRIQERWKNSVATGTRYENELRVRVANGEYRWFAVEASPVRSGDRIVEWIGMISDIHDRKRAEVSAAFLNQASELLSASLASQETLRSLARLCVPTLADWCTIDVGDGPGYKRDIVEHVDPSLVKVVLDLDSKWRAAPEVDPIVHVLQSGRSQLLEELTEDMLARLTPSPEQLEVARTLGLRSWIIAPMVARGRTLGALTVAHGDSGRRHSEEDVPLIEDLARRAAMALDNARLYEAAEAASRAKDEFLATLSHELRTPLTAIAGWAHMLDLGITDPETHRLAVQTIMRSARVQTELIDDLLDLSSVVAGTLRLNVEDVDLVTIAREVLDAATPAAEAKGVRLNGPEGAPSVGVRGDERRLRQIVWNLVTNAVKFTDAGGSVTVQVSATDAAAAIQVSDTGRGIGAAFLPHVWERFRQGDSSTSRQHGGLGLGLAVVRHLVEMHGGTVHVESEGAGKGSTFRVEIPLQA
jgi:PAS domain S-box-containing protein